jgi:hypothetical protein
MVKCTIFTAESPSPLDSDFSRSLQKHRQMKGERRKQRAESREQ